MAVLAGSLLPFVPGTPLILLAALIGMLLGTVARFAVALTMVSLSL